MELNNLINRNSLRLFILVVCGFFISVGISAQSQENVFSLYSEYVSKALDIVWEKPKGFMDLKTGTIWAQSERKGLGASCKAMLQSKDEDFLIMYPDMSLMLFSPDMKSWERLHGDPDLPKKQILADMNAALEIQSDKKEEFKQISDLSEYITILSRKEAPFNADTVFVVQIPLIKPYKETYLYCTGIYACKQGRPPMIFRCFFTEKGKLAENKFLAKFFKTVLYRNDDWLFDRKKCAKAHDEVFYK